MAEAMPFRVFGRRIGNAPPQRGARLLAVVGAMVMAMVVAFALSLAGPAGQTRAHAQPVVTVFAAASLKDALEDIATTFEQMSGTRLRLALAGSSALARQIQHGAPADLFISANAAWMDVLEREDLLAPESRTNLIGNQLVLIAHGADAAPIDLTEPGSLASALGEARLAMALLNAVPAGIYGQQALQSLGLWTNVARQVAQTDNVRVALALVITGEAPLGIVYQTDARAAMDEGHPVSIVARFPSSAHDPIYYPAAIIASRDNQGTKALMDFLRGPDTQAIFVRHGFTALSG
jgi:molybdate transport system substrate-binding protein